MAGVERSRAPPAGAVMAQARRMGPRLRDACMGQYQPGTAMPFEVTGQSGQSKLRAAGGHRPGGPTIADPERPARSYNVQPDSEAREAEAELGLGRHIWPALMADIGGTRYVTRGNMPFPQRAPPVRESVRVGGGKCRLPAGNKRGSSESCSSST